MNFDATQIDIICQVSMVLKRCPYTYTDKGALFIIGIGKIFIDFELKEIQLINWDYYDEEVGLKLMGVCHMYQLQAQDYIE
jgi:hypothetical protein